MYLLTHWIQGHLFHHLADVREYSLDQHHHHVTPAYRAYEHPNYSNCRELYQTPCRLRGWETK